MPGGRGPHATDAAARLQNREMECPLRVALSPVEIPRSRHPKVESRNLDPDPGAWKVYALIAPECSCYACS